MNNIFKSKPDALKVRNRLVAVLIFLSIAAASRRALAQQSGKEISVKTEAVTGGFPLAAPGKKAAIFIDANDAEVVHIAANALCGDIEQITGQKPLVSNAATTQVAYPVIAGTIGQSKMLDQLIAEKKLDVSAIKGKWETFTIRTIQNPWKGAKQALVIAGSDRRGTAYGLFEISKLAGVSPWVWWADVKPLKRKTLFVTPGQLSVKEPAVKYRGIFINDEDWGLNPWAKRNMDTDIKDIGPKTYARVFELMLRLRANMIWPAMHDSTKAFWYYPENPKTADRYGIIIGSTHCDMMLRSNTFEWQVSYEQEYGKKPGPYRYDTNKPEVYRYWEDRIKAASNYEAVYTIGMRGVRDGTIVGPKTLEGKIKLVDTIMNDQRAMLRKHAVGNYNNLQIFCPYKEVLDLYQGGLKVPDDVTLVWTDDNFGYIRQLSDPTEQQRSGRSGIYYHLSYLGGPHDYTWLSTNSPSLISYEMTKAYQYGADKLWVVNVGDIKPAELEIQFFMDLAWEPQKWTPQKAETYLMHWAINTFGSKVGPRIANIKKQYYQLAQQGKPEHVGLLKFDEPGKFARLKAYQSLVTEVEQVKKLMDKEQLTSFFELIEYPVKGAALMNQKVLYAQMSFDYPEKALAYSKNAKAAYEEVLSLTNKYNHELLDGKWNGIISSAPRNLSVYGMPKVAKPEVLSSDERSPKVYDKRYLDTTKITAAATAPTVSVPASAYVALNSGKNESIITINGLGAGGKSISRYPFTGVSIKADGFNTAPYADFEFALKKGNYRLSLKCLPTQAIHAGRGLGIAVSVNGGPARFADLNNAKKLKEWSAGVVRGFSETGFDFQLNETGKCKVRVYLLDAGLALSKIDVINLQSNPKN